MRLLPAAAVAAAALSGATAVWTGWLTAPAAWPRATGWERIPDAPEPTSVLHLGRPETGFDRLEIHWLGHSGFVLDWRGVRLLLDPNLSRRCTVAKRLLAGTPPPSALGPAEAALISHAHFDHLDLPTLAAVPGLAAVVMPEGSEEYAAPLEPRVRVLSLAPGGSRRFGDLEVIAVPAAHHGNRFHPLSSRKLAVGYVIRSPAATVYYAGDTGQSNDFESLGAAYHPDLAILPIGGFEPRFPIQGVHLSPEQAVAAARRLGAGLVMPCHFGTFVLALDRPATALPRFARAARRAGVAWLMPALLPARPARPAAAKPEPQPPYPEARRGR